ncbi:MAG: periplasmic heavy metal sensor [Pseudomonadota bacterium]
MDQPTTDPTPPPGTPLWLRVLLIGSLALNVLVIAAVVGLLLSGPPTRGGSGDQAMRQLGFGPYGRAFEDGHRREMRRALVQDRRELRQSLRGLRRSMTDVVAVLRAEEFDPNTLSALLTDQRQLTTVLQALGHSLVVETLAGMSDEERRAYADRLEEELPGRRFGKKRQQDKKRGDGN